MYQLTRGFSRQHRITEFTTTATHHLSGYMLCGFAYTTPYRLTPGIPSPGPATFLRHPIAYLLQRRSRAAILPLTRRLDKTTFGRLVPLIRYLARIHGYGNINPLSIDYACRPRLRSRLTLGGLTWPRNPWSFGGRVSHSSFATHACILTPVASTAGSLRCFHGHRTLPYPSQLLARKQDNAEMPRLRRCT